MDTLTLDQAANLAETYFTRRKRFPDEDETTAFLVVVLNHGDGLTAVSCVGEEWTGVKGDLVPRDGIPLCPNGHPLLESAERYRLGFVAEDLGA